MKENYASHHASATVKAPVHQVYSLFSHFNDFPKFMSFIKEVTYYDNQNSHWVADVAGQQEWDATNEQWIPDRQIGWRSTKGLDNFGKVTFEPVGLGETKIDAYVNYNPPGGVLGDIGEKLGAGSHFEKALQNDLSHFAQMVDNAPAGALDPTSSNYLFHADSAAAKGKTTQRQDETMPSRQAESARGTTAPQHDVAQPKQAEPARGATAPRHDVVQPRQAEPARGAIRPQQEDVTQPRQAEPARGAIRPQQEDVTQPRQAEPARGVTRPQQEDVAQPHHRRADEEEYRQQPDEILFPQSAPPAEPRYPPQI
jgi:uncharacterized membrane protein